MTRDGAPSTGLNTARVAVGVCVALFALGQFHRAAGAVFSPILIERFALSASAVGLLVSTLFFASVVAQVPSGVWLDRVGPRHALLVSSVCVALGTLGFALADSPAGLMASRATIGLGMAAIGAASQVLLARSVPARQFGYANGLVVSLGGVGGLLGTLPLAVALGTFAWSTVFAVVACVTVLVALAIHRTVAEPPSAPSSPSSTPTGLGLGSLLKQPDVGRILALAVVSYAPITTVTGLWGGPYLQSVHRFDPAQAGAVLMLCFAATIAAGYSFGVLDRSVRRRRRLIVVSATVSIGSLVCLAAIPALSAELAIALLLIMVFSQQFYVPLSAHLRRVVAPDVLGRAVALFTFVAVLAIPVMQTGFALVLDSAAAAGWQPSGQYRLAFAAMAVVIAGCKAVYAGSCNADEAD
ncbi:MAG: MFS transporter [Pseudomonadota bacterium]